MCPCNAPVDKKLMRKLNNNSTKKKKNNQKFIGNLISVEVQLKIKPNTQQYTELESRLNSTENWTESSRK